MQKSATAILRDGREYMDVWPMQPALAVVFPENRIIRLTRWAMGYFPAIAAISLVVQLQYFGYEHLSPALAIALLILSMPLQGLIWLGMRANTILPPAVALWYKEIYENMVSQGYQPKPLGPNPKYRDMAHLLRKAFDEMDKGFTKTWF